MFRQVYNALIGNGNVIVKDATSIFFNCKNQADKRIWYTKGLVTDDFRSRHTLLLLHIWIINSRLVNKEGKRGLQTQECLFDEFWDETSKRIRAVGINELSVNKRLLEVQKYSWQVCTELDSTMATTKQTDVEKLDNIGSILWRHLYNENDSIEDTHVLILAKYIRNEHTSIVHLPVDALFNGRFSWGQIPWSSDISTVDSSHTTGSKDIRHSDTNNKNNEWVSAVSDNGQTYYWNKKTMEVQWTKPPEI